MRIYIRASTAIKALTIKIPQYKNILFFMQAFGKKKYKARINRCLIFYLAHNATTNCHHTDRSFISHYDSWIGMNFEVSMKSKHF